MATTTNYGWTTPDDTALVKDGASAIRTLGSSVDTTTKNLNPETTLGDISFRSSTSNVNTRLAIGSTGNVLTVSGGVPTWAAPAGGGGKVLQVVQATTATLTTITSASYTDVTNLTASITPSANTSKVLIMINTTCFVQATSVREVGAGAQIVRNSTAIFTNDNAVSMDILPIPSSVHNLSSMQSFIFLDSPATTSSTTYKLQGKQTAGNGTYWNNGGAGNAIASIILMEIGA